MTNQTEKADPPYPLDPFFIQCLIEAIDCPDLVEQFDRLYGSNLALKGIGIDLVIDKTTGRLQDNIRDFADFVHKYVYNIVVAQCPQSLK